VARAEDEVSTVALPLSGVAPAWHVRRLVVLEGPDAGRSFLLDPNAPGRSMIGSGPACAIRLTDRTVSRRHAGLEPVANGVHVTDLASTNGTFIGDVRIFDAVARPGQIVRCGDTAVRLEAQPEAEAPPLPVTGAFGQVLGASLAMRRLYPLCDRLAASTVPVVIEGETGTGKEALAEAIHAASRPAGPFVVFDCTAVSPTLVEAELFGHEKGAFTGAVGARPGVFEQADSGTLLIDEIGDLELGLQAKLLRVIDRAELRRVGGQKTLKVDVRVLAATRRNLDSLVAQGRFRDDLFHRLAIGRIELPPLRERQGDVQLLARSFGAAMGASKEVVDTWLANHTDYPWPGNVRELKNAVARLVALGADAAVLRSHAGSLPPPSRPDGDWIDSFASTGIPFALARRRVVEEFERRYTERVLAEHGGNVTHAARASGIALRYFQLVKARAQKT
jgi:DNA-binding NtrC family response regulator